jgi:hypothetical protein
VYLSWIFQYFISIFLCLPCISNPGSSGISICLLPLAQYLTWISHPRSPCISLGSPCISSRSEGAPIFVYLLRISIYFLKISLCLLGILLDVSVSSLDLPSRIFKYFLSISLYLPFVSNLQSFLYPPVSPSDFTRSRIPNLPAPPSYLLRISLQMPRSPSISYESLCISNKSQYIFSKSPCIFFGCSWISLYLPWIVHPGSSSISSRSPSISPLSLSQYLA